MCKQFKRISLWKRQKSSEDKCHPPPSLFPQPKNGKEHLLVLVDELQLAISVAFITMATDTHIYLLLLHASSLCIAAFYLQSCREGLQLYYGDQRFLDLLAYCLLFNGKKVFSIPWKCSFYKQTKSSLQFPLQHNLQCPRFSQKNPLWNIVPLGHWARAVFLIWDHIAPCTLQWGGEGEVSQVKIV